MRIFRKISLALFCAAALWLAGGAAQTAQSASVKPVAFDLKAGQKTKQFLLANELVQCAISIESNRLVSDEVKALPEWLSTFNSTSELAVQTDADFLLDVMWTGWTAPGKVDNADNPAELTKQNFQLAEHKIRELPGGGKELDLFFRGFRRMPLEVCLTYQLEPDSFFIKRKLAVRAAAPSQAAASRPPPHAAHFLRWTWPRRGAILGKINIVKAGGFGQPFAFQIGPGGSFFGLEYTTSNNTLRAVDAERSELACGQEIGRLIGDSWIESEWVVEAITPEPFIKKWFWKYVDRIRVAPLKPYILYNSWYDLRAPEYVKIPARSLTEKNLLSTIEFFRTRMFEKRGLRLDAFVLDDGWDVYRSDWVLNKDQFPRGLTPLAEALKPMGTRLGIWFGPIGGYSNRNLRLEYMKSHGYEVVGDQLCLAGTNYKALLKKRTTDFVRDDGIGYYKWDGIQFSCSEPNHGHPQDIYSRRAVMESLIELARAVRAENKDAFLNVTSGTWLSPWWVKYANTIWMQGSDYGYADVPSISLRDGAITYRDSVLYDGLIHQDSWFPIANLMTHGLIKGHLQMLGGKEETLDKFTTEVLLYFARGIEMWELYLSPDVLTEAEWDALAQGIRWAKDRFDILKWTDMVGGDPDKFEPYGFVHFTGKKGILAVRNPGMEPKSLSVRLGVSYGLADDAKNLVLERVYPNRWISPRLYQAESDVELPLEGYETAIYEVYPLEEAKEPLVAGTIFDAAMSGKDRYRIRCFDAGQGSKLLNPQLVRSLRFRGGRVDPEQFKLAQRPILQAVAGTLFQGQAGQGRYVVNAKFILQSPAKEGTLAFLLQQSGEPSPNRRDPDVTILLDGKKAEVKTENQKGSWSWFKIKVKPGTHSARLEIALSKDMQGFVGKTSAWLVEQEKPQPEEIQLNLRNELTLSRPMPPLPFPVGVIVKNYKVGETAIEINRQ